MLNSRRAALLAALAAAAVLAAGCKTSTGGGTASTGASSGATVASSNAPAHSEDVAITACTPDAAGFAAAKVVVTNHSSKASNYIINIVMESPDGKTQIGTGLVSVNGLAPGQASSPQDASSLQSVNGPYTCRVGDITRYAS